MKSDLDKIRVKIYRPSHLPFVVWFRLAQQWGSKRSLADDLPWQLEVAHRGRHRPFAQGRGQSRGYQLVRFPSPEKYACTLSHSWTKDQKNFGLTQSGRGHCKRKIWQAELDWAVEECLGQAPRILEHNERQDCGSRLPWVRTELQIYQQAPHRT